MAWVIKDTNTDEYYRQRCSTNGWYSTDINTARLFTTAKQAQQTINADGHHVTYPGWRKLVVKEVQLIEI